MDLSDFILVDNMIDDEGNDREKIRKLENEVLLLKKEMLNIRLASKLEMSQKIEKNLRKEMMKKQAEYETETEILLQKIAGLEKAKCLLQSDVEVLNEDLEKAQETNAKMMQKLAEYEEADAARRDAENRTLAELQALRIEMERRLQEKVEEIENLRKNKQFEIDHLSAALADAEAQMKTEIPLLKKKYLAEKAEMEMKIDNLNDANFEAHLTIKKQNEQIKALKASLENAAELKQGINKLTVEFKNDDINAPKQQHCNNAYEEQFKELYEINDDPERKKWLDDWFQFMAQNGKPVTRIPIMAKKVLDLYKLYNAVVKCGGIVEVINKKLWRDVTKALELSNSLISAAFTLRSQYCRYLYAYECHQHNLSKLDAPEAILRVNEPI